VATGTNYSDALTGYYQGDDVPVVRTFQPGEGRIVRVAWLTFKSLITDPDTLAVLQIEVNGTAQAKGQVVNSGGDTTVTFNLTPAQSRLVNRLLYWDIQVRYDNKRTFTAFKGTATFEQDVTFNEVPTLIPVATVTMTPTSATIASAATQQFTVTLVDEESNTVTRPITYSSSNPSVATVDSTGLATGVAAGTATITATSEGLSDTSTLTVT
jgi:uncharacterized protein YjdB